jgi:hypothetical protein
MANLPIFPIVLMLAASKANSYQKKTLKLAKVLAEFLENNKLVARPLLTPDGQVDPKRDFMQSDLTDEGNLLMSKCLTKWVSYTDRGGDIENTKILQDSLARIRSGNPESSKKKPKK